MDCAQALMGALLLLAGSPAAAAPSEVASPTAGRTVHAIERAILSDGRDLICQSRRSVEGGWLIGLPDGGSILVAAPLVDRFEAIASPAEEPGEPEGGPDAPVPEDASPLTGETLQETIARIAAEFAVDPDLVEAVVYVESRFDPFAVSPKGAAGLMQLMPRTADRFRVSDVFDPVENIRGGVEYLSILSKRFGGDLALVLAAYNAGEGAVARHVGVPPYRETRRYVIQVLERYLARRPPAR